MPGINRIIDRSNIVFTLRDFCLESVISVIYPIKCARQFPIVKVVEGIWLAIPVGNETGSGNRNRPGKQVDYTSRLRAKVLKQIATIVRYLTRIRIGDVLYSAAAILGQNHGLELPVVAAFGSRKFVNADKVLRAVTIKIGYLIASSGLAYRILLKLTCCLEPFYFGSVILGRTTLRGT